MEAEGMMFVGDKGKVLAGFHGENPRLIPEERTKQYATANPAPGPQFGGRGEGVTPWIAACRGGKPTYGDFLLAGPISDAFNLGAVSLRLGGRRLLFDAANVKVTNIPEANKNIEKAGS
ncbi:MAG: hypothetical protein DME18_12600 [Verrucomicrobia bacterium]|nr:MAG: hypothetical protein DME18_12600 [Verrucomicrobiota bacterium]